MKKRIIPLLFLLFCFITTNLMADDPKKAYRSWEYLNLPVVLSPNWTYNILLSHAYEYKRENDPAKLDEEKKTYFHEVFTGPMYTIKSGDFTLRLPLWYYYQGFPVKQASNSTYPNAYYYSHNVEFLPIVEYKIGNFKIWNRVIFHNKFYSSYYEKDKRLKDSGKDQDGKGYSLLLREYLRFEYNVTESFRLLIGDEIFYGTIEDKDTKDITPDRLGGPGGFELKGFSQNRLYAGFGYNFTKEFSIEPLYMYQRAYTNKENKKELVEEDHYLFITFTYVIKTF